MITAIERKVRGFVFISICAWQAYPLQTALTNFITMQLNEKQKDAMERLFNFLFLLKLDVWFQWILTHSPKMRIWWLLLLKRKVRWFHLHLLNITILSNKILTNLQEIKMSSVVRPFIALILGSTKAFLSHIISFVLFQNPSVKENHEVNKVNTI
jgi:hypothetical protein